VADHAGRKSSCEILRIARADAAQWMAHLVTGPDVASGPVGVAVKPTGWNSRDSAELTWRRAEASPALSFSSCLPLLFTAGLLGIEGACAPVTRSPASALSAILSTKWQISRAGTFFEVSLLDNYMT